MQIPDFIIKISELPNKGAFYAVKLIFELLALVFGIATVYFIFRTDWFQKRFGYDLNDLFGFGKSGASRTSKRWQAIKQRLEREDPAEHELAIIEAENLLIELLAKKGIKGETLLEQLENIDPYFLSTDLLEELLEVHKIRNNVVHDPDYQLSKDEARKVIDIIEKTLQSLTV